jgi:hypothetical protein
MGSRDRSVGLMRWGLLLASLVAFGQGHAQGPGALWAEAALGQDTVHAQESVVYTVRVFSPGSLQKVELTPPAPAGASLEELERGTVSTQLLRGQRYVVTEYHYMLTPIQPGVVEVPAVRLEVQTAPEPRLGQPPGWGGRSSSLSTRPLRLTVLPLPAGAGLPLRFLDVKAHWGQEGAQRSGEPLTLTVVTKALGTVGARLPSTASLLTSRDFKIYPDNPQTDWRWGNGGPGRDLWGRRVETFTVVPTREGSLTFPAIEVPWWDVRNNREARAVVPERTVSVGSAALARRAAGEGSTASFVGRLLNRQTLLQFVLPVGGGLALAFLLGWWLGLGRRIPPRPGPGGDALRVSAPPAALSGSEPRPVAAGPEAPPPAATPAASAPGTPTVEAAVPPRRWSLAWRPSLGTLPARLRGSSALAGVRVAGARARAWAGQVSGRVASVLPFRLKAWWCVRCALREKQPEALCRVLRRFACQHLGMSPNAPLISIVDRLSRQHPEVGGLREAFIALEDATYAGRALDLRAWKREFRRRFRRAFAARPDRGGFPRPRRGLPELNP